MKLGLKERFQPDNAFNPREDPLVRLGSLYRLSQQPDLDRVRLDLSNLLSTQNGNPVEPQDLDTSLLCFHAAVLLAQHNSFEGVQWIVQQVRTAPTPNLHALAETALRNCSQFPLAVLLTQSIELNGAWCKTHERLI